MTVLRDEWPLAGQVNELRVVMSAWQPLGGLGDPIHEVEFQARGCSTPVGPLAAGYVILTVRPTAPLAAPGAGNWAWPPTTAHNAKMWVGSANLAQHGNARVTVYARPRGCKGWPTISRTKKAMEDLLYDRPSARRLSLLRCHYLYGPQYEGDIGVIVERWASGEWRETKDRLIFPAALPGDHGGHQCTLSGARR